MTHENLLVLVVYGSCCILRVHF